MVQRRRIQAEYDSIAELRREIRIWGDNGDWKLWSREAEEVSQRELQESA